MENEEKINVSNMNDEEFNQIMKDKIENLSKEIDESKHRLDRILDGTGYSYINNKKIIDNICVMPYFFTISVIMSIVLILIIYFGLSTWIEPILNEMSERESKIAILIFFAIVGSIFYFIYSAKKQTLKSFAEENFMNAQLFKSDFIKKYKTMNLDENNKSMFNYYVKYKDENGKTRKNKIPKKEYELYKEIPYYIYVIKYPRPNNKSIYLAYHPKYFENKSSIRLKDKSFVT